MIPTKNLYKVRFGRYSDQKPYANTDCWTRKIAKHFDKPSSPVLGLSFTPRMPNAKHQARLEAGA